MKLTTRVGFEPEKLHVEWTASVPARDLALRLRYPIRACTNIALMSPEDGLVERLLLTVPFRIGGKAQRLRHWRGKNVDNDVTRGTAGKRVLAAIRQTMIESIMIGHEEMIAEPAPLCVFEPYGRLRLYGKVIRANESLTVRFRSSYEDGFAFTAHLVLTPRRAVEVPLASASDLT
jgi:hypothetical protein